MLCSTLAARGDSYVWKNVTIKGGGFVSGIITHPNGPGIVYARTDIGGAYRWNPASSSWVPLLDFAADSNLGGVESIALDPSDTNRLYIATSRGSPAVLLVSTNQGATFTQYTPPFSLNGNVDGRSNGERMIVDPNLGSILFYGTRTAGLYKSINSGASWSKVTSFPISMTTNSVGLNFVQFVQSSGSPDSATPTIFVGVSQAGGTNLFISTDAGVTWTNVPTVAPTTQMPHHAAQDGLGSMYVTFNDNQGPNNITDGTVIKLNLTTLTSVSVTPAKNGAQGGFAGVCVDQQHPTTVVVSTMDRWYPSPYDQVYRSTNGGSTWKTTASGLPSNASAPWAAERTPHWCGDVEIDPFNSNRAWYITGYGVFSCSNLTASDNNGTVNWAFTNDGLEEMVSEGLASPPSGPYLLSNYGDQGGFRHYNLDVTPPNSDYFSTHRGSSYGIDFAEGNPSVIARLFSGTPYGCYSLDGGTSWSDFTLATLPALSSQGNIAVSADGSRFVWVPGASVSASSIAYYSTDHGATWTASTGGPSGGPAPIADRVNSGKFYIYSGGTVYVSTDGGATFAAKANSNVSSGSNLRAVFGHEGDLWLPRGNSGLSRSTDSGTSFAAVSTVNRATFVGFGKAAPGQSYPAVFISGRVGGVDGFYRSDDTGATWTRIDDAQHQFGRASIHALCADPRVYGRLYFGTEGRSTIYGDLVVVPTAPAALVAQAGDSQVALGWSTVSGATNYFIKRSTVGGGGYSTVGTNTSLIWTNNGLANGTNYYFVVSALGTAGESTNSVEKSARPYSLQPAPVGFTVLAGGQLELDWPADHVGWRLQSQTNTSGSGLGSAWHDVPGSALTNQFFLPMDPSGDNVFLRLISP